MKAAAAGGGLILGVGGSKVKGRLMKQAQSNPYQRELDRLVQRTMAERGITDARVLAAMRRVPRHAFVDEDLWEQAYSDRPLPIGCGQTISQPYMVAEMTALLGCGAGARVLEIGTGCGYQAAVLAEMGWQVYSIEVIEALAREASDRLRRLGYGQVHVRWGDGYAGWPEAAPFDGMLVTAAVRQPPSPLVDQLAVGGRLVLPVGEPGVVQQLVLLERTEQDTVRQEALMPVQFVPFTGPGISGAAR